MDFGGCRRESPITSRKISDASVQWGSHMINQRTNPFGRTNHIIRSKSAPGFAGGFFLVHQRKNMAPPKVLHGSKVSVKESFFEGDFHLPALEETVENKSRCSLWIGT